MFKLLTFRKCNLLLGKSFNFSTATDPYYILGVEKNAEIDEIKKKFYELANEYHPDKNDTSDAKSKFLLVKEAYEAIKMQRGLINPQPTIYDHEDTTMRPDPSRFTSEGDEYIRTGADYRMHQEKAEAAGEQYIKFKKSFKTIHDITDVKIRVEEGEMKDWTSRFGLEKFKAKIQSLSEGSNMYLVYIFLGMIVFYTIYPSFKNSIDNQKLERQVQQSEKKMILKQKLYTPEEISFEKKKKRLEDLKKDKQVGNLDAIIIREEVFTSKKQSV